MKLGTYDPYSITRKHMLDNAIAKAGAIAKSLGHHPTGWNMDYDNDAGTFHCCMCNAGVDVTLNTRYEAYTMGRIVTISCKDIQCQSH